jgi:hypothetical protein
MDNEKVLMEVAMGNEKRTRKAALWIILIIVVMGATAAVANTLDAPVYLPIVMRNASSGPSPTPLPGVVLLPNHSSYTNVDGGPVVVGEVLNSTGSPVQFVEIKASYFDGNGSLLETDWIYVWIDTLHVGEKGCFRISGNKAVPGLASYELTVVDFMPSSIPRPNLALLNHNGSHDNKWYRVIGEVRNDEPQPIYDIMVVITAYDGNGNVFECDLTSTNPLDLDPGQSTPFMSLMSYRDDYSAVDSYRVDVDGTR